jgi:hypothetical protein
LPHRPHLRTNGRAANLHLDRVPGVAIDVQTVRRREGHGPEGLGPPGIGVDEELGGRRRGRVTRIGVDADSVEVTAICEIEVHEGVEVPVVQVRDAHVHLEDAVMDCRHIGRQHLGVLGDTSGRLFQVTVGGAPSATRDRLGPTGRKSPTRDPVEILGVRHGVADIVGGQVVSDRVADSHEGLLGGF